jgi:hypothetical protein
LPSWSFRAAKEAMALLALDGANREVAEYWLSLWTGTTPPQGRDFNLSQLGQNAAAAALLEVGPDETIVCCDAGRYFAVLLGKNPVGENLLKDATSHERQERLRRAQAMVDGAIMYGERIFASESGDLRVPELYLPFAGAGAHGERYVLSHSNWRPGDNVFAYGITDASLAANLRILPIVEPDQ